jgi:hypothetical protein
MPLWSSADFNLEKRDVARMRWLRIYYGSPLRRLSSAVLVIAYYGGLMIGGISALAVLFTSGLSITVVVWLYISLLILIVAVRSRRHRRARPGIDLFKMKRRYSFDRHGVISDFDDGKSYMQWRSISHIVRTRAGLYLIQSDVLCYILPRRIFASRTDFDTACDMAVRLKNEAPADEELPADWPPRAPDRPPDVRYQATPADVRSVVPRQIVGRQITGIVIFLLLSVIGVTVALGDSHAGALRLTADWALVAFLLSVLAASASAVGYSRQMITWSTGTPWEIWIEPDHYVIAGGNQQQVSSWGILSKVDLRGGCICFDQSTGIVRAIPLTAWDRPADANLFLANAKAYHDMALRAIAGGGHSEDVWPPPPTSAGHRS